MKQFLRAIKRFFAPPANSTALARVAPYAVIALLMVLLFVFGTTAWEYTNTAQFCGLTCHTMPPEYQTFVRSPHANMSCEDCHLGRDVMSVMIPRKVTYSWQTGSAMVTGNYHYPIIAKNMRPARDACENCHTPEKFSSDKMVEIKRFANDQANTLTTIYMLLKTGGGTARQGLGFGIHWHVENPVYYYATDPQQQNIPYVVVTKPDGSTEQFVDASANIDIQSIKKEQLQQMDCITCHNRTAHAILNPSATMDDLMGRSVVSPTIPEIHQKGLDLLSAKYTSQEQAVTAISALDQFYKVNYPDYYSVNSAVVKFAVNSIKDAYLNSVFPDQKMDWTTHPDNLQHMDSPGCFRCHDGKHVSPDGKNTVRLECNLCHSIPTVSTSFQLVSDLPVAKQIEPANHQNPNWIAMHRSSFDKSCQTCHTVADAGGTSNTSFCSNSICHSANLKYVGLDAPQMRQIVQAQLPTPAPTAQPSPTSVTTQPAGATQATVQATQAAGSGSPVTFAQVGPVFTAKCIRCHGATGPKGLSLLSYASMMAGGNGGPVIVPGQADASQLVKTQSAGGHPGQLSADELTLIKQWITAGALEK
jgi:mono/diheme cytochrome c family protein/nitrate/TMAO reductase-like tetraheme cytochrome c subunit